MTRPVQCVDELALGEVLALAESDPRRRHLDDCPRCRALVVSYRQFLDPGSEEMASYGTEEHERLNAFRERLAGIAPVATPAPGGTMPAPVAEKRSWAERLFTPGLRPLWAVVAIAIAFGVMKIAPTHPPENVVPTLRGGTPEALTVRTPTYGDAGAVTLVWNAVPEADHYEVRFFSSALTELGRHAAGGDTVATLAAADLPLPYRSGEAILFRVVALKDGDELATSAPGSLKKP